MFLFAFAALGAQAAAVATVNGTGYETLEAAIAAAEPVDGVVTYEICGKAEVSATGWIQVLKSGLSNVKKVAFVGTTEDAEICIAGGLAILADQQYDIDVSFRDLKLSKPNPEYGGDYGHSTNYFTTWLRNTGAAENTVTYENCTFPNGACNNQYGKTVYTNCTFANGTTGLYNLWIYGGSVEMDGGVFTGTRGMKVYTEGTPATAPSVEVKGTAFSGLTEKAAIVVSKAATVKFAEVSVADCSKGLFQKDIEGSSDDQKVTVTANGSKISGSFAITANREPETAKTEFNITGGMFTAEVPSDYCADGFTVKATTDADGNTVYGVVEKTELVNYVTLELVFGDNVADEDVVAAKALYAQEKYETCKAANEAYMALFGVTWGKGYLDVTDNTAPLYKYAGRSGSVSEVRFYIHGTLAGFTSLQSSGNQIDCTVGGNHQISRTSYSIIGVDGADGKAKLTDGNVQAYVAGGYASMFTASGKLTIDNIEFTSTTSTTVGASATRATESDTENEVASAEMEIKNCTFRGRLYVYDNFENQGKMTYSIHNCVFDGSNYSGDSNAYAIFAQCKGGNNLVIKDNKIAGFARGINIDHANVHATIEGNKISVTDTGRSCIQLSSLAKADIVGNTLELTGGNAITLHEKLLTLGVVPEVSISGNTVTGTGYLIYDDAKANDKEFTSVNLKLTYATDNTVAATVDTTQGVKDATKYELSGTVATTLHSVDFAAFVDALKAANNTFDGSKYALAQNGKLTVKWSPVSGCYDTREGHECTVGNVTATANTPKRVNSGLTQFQLFEGESHAVNVKNVAFVYEPAVFTVCENSGWKGMFTAEQAPAGQIYLMNTGDVTFEGCSFDKVVLTSFNCTGTSTVKHCSFKNVYNSYAVKDIRGAKVAVTGCTFENCGAAVMVSSTVKVEEVTISDNTFKNVDVVGTTPADKVGTRGLVQIASLGNYAETAFDFSGNTAMDCGPVLRQLNSTVSFDPDDKTNLGKLVSDGGASTFYTDDTFVAQVGDTKYATLAEAIAVLSAENHTLTLLNENAWDATTPVYWAAGAQSGYAATLTEALTAAYKADAGAITVVCRPGADVGEMTHGHVADDLTIYGNDAYLSGGECDLEVDTYTFSRATGKQTTDGVCLDKDITITAYELDNLGVWGERHTANKVTVNLTDCDGKALEGKTNVQRVYISGTTGVNNITLTDCDFLTKATAVYSNADGAIKAVNCSFTGGQVPFNINHKANGTQTVAVENCTFTNCGDVGDWKQFAAPLRLVNSGAGTQSAEVTGCAFAGTVGANGDILLGDGRPGQTSNDVELKVVNTAANIQAQKPGYYGVETVDATKKATATSPASGTLETSVAKLLPVDPRTLGYATSGKAEALPATPDMNGEVVNVTAAQAQYVLDGAYGPIDGKTINFTESINDTLILGRASKYDGSKTVYRHGSHAGEALSYADFIAYKNQSGWTESCYYERTVENVTFTANEGVTVKNFEADGGAHIYAGAGTAPVYDYVRDTGSWVTEGSCYFKRAILKNITFKGLTFKAKTDINTSESTTVYDGFTFKDCTFDLGTTADGNQAIRYYNENNNGNVKNLVVEGCTFKTCSQGVYTAHVKNVTVTGSTFDTTGHNAIAIQDFKGACDHGAVVITGNTFKGIGDRIIRFNNVGMGTTVTITGNTADGNSGKLDEATGKREIVKATTLPVNAADSIKASDNNWGANTVVEGVFIDDYATKLGTEACPYSREQFAAMTRAEYIAAQERLGGTLYVNVGNYAYEKNGVLGNGVRDDTPGQNPDHAKLNAYGENGYLGEKNDGANGHAVVFVGGTITSGVTGYTSIDSIGTSLLLAVPAYTKVTFKETTFKNVLSFDYQLYTSPWSQLGGLTFNGCTFDGIIVGAIAAQELAFNGCTFNNYVNTTDANNSNPTWIRPAYGNWTKGDNEGQGTDFRSLTKITFENNTVTSTRPVKFERIAQWEMATTVTATNNTFAITPQEGDKNEKKTKNVGLYFGANAKFDLVIDKNEKRGETAALYTAVYLAPTGGTYAGLPAGSTVKNTAGEEVATGDGDALAWKTTDKITLKTTTEVASVTNATGVSVNFATLSEAVKAAQAGETVTLLADVESVSVTTVVAGKDIVLDLNGKTLTSTANNGITIEATAKLTVKDSLTGGKVVATGKYSNAIENKGTLVIESGSFEAVYGAIRALGGSTTTINGGTFASSTGRYGMYYWANGTALSVTVNGGLFKNSVSTAMENGKVALSIKGGSFASDLTDYCGADAGTYLDKETGLYVYGRESEHVPEGYVVDENGNVTISDEESLFWFAQQVNVRGNTFTGKTVSLADDIALTAKWTPVGVSVEKSFKGTFDGKDHAITGMKVSGGAYGHGFFKLVISATVKNVTFAQAEVKCEYSNVVGCVAGYSYGSSTFENVHVTDSLVYAFGKVGGFVGMAEDAGATTTFRNCSVEATTIHGGYNVAGFCGLVMGTCAFSGSSLTDVTPVVDEDSQGFGKVVELDTTVVCDGSVATCAGKGTSIKGRYIPNNGCYWSAYSDLYNHYGDSKHDCTLADGKMLANSEVVHDAPVAIGDARYSDLQAAFDAAKTGDTVTLLSDITLTEQVNITKALDGLTLDGNGKTIICATTDDPLKSGGGSALYFGNANDHLYCTGIKIKDLTMTGTARFAIFLCGGTTTEFTNVKISGNYYIAVNLYGTHGATMTNCDISNSTKGTDKYISAIWSNVASANPLTLNNSKVDVIAINTYTTANKLEPKIFVMDGSEVGEIHTFDDGSVSGNKKLCVSDGSTGSYVVKEYDEATSTWVNLRVAQIGTVGYETLEAALAAAKTGETVKMLADVTLTAKQTIDKAVVLDLNGKTISSTAYWTISLGSGANVTIRDSSTGQNGKITNGNTGYSYPRTIYLDASGAAALTVESGIVESNPNIATLQSVAIDTDNKTTGPYVITITGGKVLVPESSTKGRAIVASKNTTLNITGGEIVGGLHGVDVYGDSTTAITGGSISARVVDTGVIKAAYGLRAIGTASVTIGAADGTADVVSVAGIKMDDDGYKLNVPAVTVNSGTIAGPVYSITPGTIVFNVQATSEDVLRFADDTAAKFLPSNLELRAKDIDGKTMYYVAAKPVAAIGTIDYATLADAIAAAKDGETVKLLADVNGDGIAIAPNTFKTGLTVDFGGHTYTVGGLLVGSSGTASNGFQLNAGNKITFKNGAIVGATATAGAGTDWKGAPAILIQNYCDLTLEQMTVKGGDETCYTLSNNNGEIVIDGSTIVAGKGTKLGPFAFDVCRYSSYPSVHVTVKGASVIEGNVEISGTIGDNQSRQLDIEGGTFKGAFKVVDQPANIAISGGTFSDAVLPEYCAAGFIPTANDDGTYGVKAGAYVAVTLGGEKKEMPFPDAWLAANISADASSWTTEALEEKAANELAKWQCYLFGLDPNKKDAKVVATAGQGTDETIPLAVANADASASPLVTGGYVTVAYVLMGSNDRTAWTQVATSDERDGLAIPLTGTTYKFYRVDVTVTSAEGN